MTRLWAGKVVGAIALASVGLAGCSAMPGGERGTPAPTTVNAPVTASAPGPASAPAPAPKPVVAAPTGVWVVSGTSVNNGRAYTSFVAVNPVGDAYEVIFTQEGKRLDGVGILQDGAFLVGALIGERKEPSVMALKPQPDGSWSGRWTMRGATTSGVETWTRR